MGPPREPSKAGRVGRGGRNEAGEIPAIGGDAAERNFFRRGPPGVGKAHLASALGLAHTGRPEEYHVFPVLQEAHGGKLVDLALVDGGLEGEIKVIQGFLNGEAGHLDLFLIGPFPLGFGFFRKDMVQNVHNVEIFRHRPFQIVIQNLQGVLHLEAFQVFPQPVRL